MEWVNGSNDCGAFFIMDWESRMGYMKMARVCYGPDHNHPQLANLTQEICVTCTGLRSGTIVCCRFGGTTNQTVINRNLRVVRKCRCLIRTRPVVSSGASLLKCGVLFHGPFFLSSNPNHQQPFCPESRPGGSPTPSLLNWSPSDNFETGNNN